MAERESGEERREQIVEATLALLADHPLSEVTTRRIAAAVGITQPGLFRHFDGRDAIVLAAVARLEGALGAVAAGALDLRGLQAIEALTAGILATATRWPGLPRLLFQTTGGPDSALRGPLAHVASAQEALLSELSRRAIAAGALPAVSPTRAAGHLAALIQGALLRAQRTGDPPVSAVELVALWGAGLAALPREALGEPTAQLPTAGRIDARPLLAAGVDPLGAVLAALDAAAPGDALVITAPFRPGPLIAVLRGRGCAVEVGQVEPSVWEITAQVPGEGA